MPEVFTNALPRAAITTEWDDLRSPISALAPGATPADPIVYGPGGSVRIRGFDGGAITESMDLSVQLPHSYKEGTDIHPHVHWCPTTNNAGNVIWRLDYYWVNMQDLIPVLAQIDTGAVAASGAAWQHLVADFAAISGAGKLISSMLMCRIWRDPTTDTYPDDAGLLEVDFHFELDSIGSRAEHSK
jgi:hypothetical protein